MTVRLVLTAPGELIYCPYHRAWEVYIGEDPALCDWCCQFQPCSMHKEDVDAEDGSGVAIIGPDAIEQYDPFDVEFDSPREMLAMARERAGRPEPLEKGSSTPREEVSEWIDIANL